MVEELAQAIREAEHNQIDRLLDHFADLRAIAFNGGKAASIGRALIGSDPHVRLIDLPSSSPANTSSFAQKAAAWEVLREFVRP